MNAMVPGAGIDARLHTWGFGASLSCLARSRVRRRDNRAGESSFCHGGQNHHLVSTIHTARVPFVDTHIIV